MAGQKHLHELLSQDQEPFLLHDYILDHRRQLNHPLLTARLHRMGTEPVSLSKPKLWGSHFPVHYDFCLKRLLFAGSLDPTKSPLFEFPSAGASLRSPCHRGAVSLRVPARTAALLVEAASRIQRKGSARPSRRRNLGNGFMGLIMKRFAQWKSKAVRFGGNGGGDNGPSHVETASCGSDHGLGSDVVGNGVVHNENSCKSSLPFETPECSIPVGRSPEFSSPPASPKYFGEGNEGEPSREAGIPKGKNGVDEEEEREQFSPVSVLDPPFDDDGDSHVVDLEEDNGDVGFDYECSYAFVQRTKQQLLDKLQRFERLARLDPVELEKRMLESDKDVDDGQSVSIEDATTKAPEGISKLVADLVGDSGSSGFENARWEESPTIDVIVDRDLRAQWKPDDGQFSVLAEEIEFGMLESLVEELTMEISCC